MTRLELEGLPWEVSLWKLARAQLTDRSLGGISFVSRRHGWALDNVRNFEVSSRLVYTGVYSNLYAC
jgi:hypothetical protein